MNTVLTEREELVCNISDISKTAYGCRLRLHWDDMSIDELKSTLDNVCNAADEQMKYEAEQEARSVAQFEEAIEDSIRIGAGDRETAIRWLIQAEDLESEWSEDKDYVCYRLGLPYGYFKK